MTLQFSLAPLITAAPAIPIHAFAAIGAFMVGLLQFSLPKGAKRHRALGYVWLGLMGVVTISSFWIHQIRQWGDFSWIHLLSAFVLIQLPIAVIAARRGNLVAHRRIMRGIFLGGLVVAGGFTFMPGRIMHAVMFGG
ncbi:MAG: DUF2306 domain-containing protein [Elsteraceae bacterium]